MTKGSAAPSPRPDRAVATQGREIDKKRTLAEASAVGQSMDAAQPETAEIGENTPFVAGAFDWLTGGRDSLLLGIIWSEVLQPPRSRRPR